MINLETDDVTRFIRHVSCGIHPLGELSQVARIWPENDGKVSSKSLWGLKWPTRGPIQLHSLKTKLQVNWSLLVTTAKQQQQVFVVTLLNQILDGWPCNLFDLLVPVQYQLKLLSQECNMHATVAKVLGGELSQGLKVTRYQTSVTDVKKHRPSNFQHFDAVSDVQI